MGWVAGALGGLLVGAVGASALVVLRIQSLSQIDFEIRPPPVPLEVIETVRQAERRYYATQSNARQAIELAQDVLAFLHPPLVYRLNLSVGPYRLKGRTLDEMIPWAQQQGYLAVTEAPLAYFHWLYVYLAEQPGLAHWGAATHLEFLRQRHPRLREMDWEMVAADPELIAKIYSGYLGAGNDWPLWEADLVPGKVALSRLADVSSVDSSAE